MQNVWFVSVKVCYNTLLRTLLEVDLFDFNCAWGVYMSKAKNENQNETKQTASSNRGKRGSKKKKKFNLSQILSGIGLLAITAYTGWIIVQAPSAAGMEFSQYNALLREQMGIIGSMIYLLMQSLVGHGVLLFPIIFAAAGIALITDRLPTGMQKTGVVLACLIILTLLHVNVTYISAKDNLMLGLMGSGGGVIGAAVSMLLLNSIGQVGTYIALACFTIIAAILIGYNVLTQHGSDIFAGIKHGLLRMKQAIANFIFVEVEEVEEAPKTKSKKAVQQDAIEVEGNSPSRKRLIASKDAKTTVKQSTETNGQQGVMSNLKEIHKTLGQQNVVVPEVVEDTPDEAEDVIAMQPEIRPLDDNVVDFRTRLEQLSMQEQESDEQTNESTQRSFITIEVADAEEDTVMAEEPMPEASAPEQSAEQKAEQRRKKKVYAEELPEFVPIETEEVEKENAYQFPPIELLDPNPNGAGRKNMTELQSNVERLEKTLNDFGVKGRIADVSCGPAITQYEFQPAAGVKVSKIVNLSDDIALSMAVAGVRIEAPIPGKAAVGIEIPNKTTSMVCLREVVESDVFQNSKSKLTVALGKDISGKPIIADLAKMPHLLIAGSTGSGKSVCMNALINSILYKATPDEVKFLMVDPKKVELGNYNGIPHLISPVVTDAKKAASALRWAVHEMERRYELFAANGVKDMPRFNALSEQRISEAQTEEEKAGIEIMPYIVVLIDELADLMMVAPADVEDAICRLAQMARAAGIHLVVATQRPSVDVITGIIKANIPSRIAFAVSSQIDSRTILDMGGAEKLLGRGDMLFYPTGLPKPQRVQGVYVSDKEIDRIVEAVKVQGKPVYNEAIVNVEIKSETVGGEEAEEWDDLIPEAAKLFIENGQASISLLQRRFRVGYTRAARIVDQMEQRGLVGPYEGSKPRQIKITMAQYNEMIENGEL